MKKHQIHFISLILILPLIFMVYGCGNDGPGGGGDDDTYFSANQIYGIWAFSSGSSTAKTIYVFDKNNTCKVYGHNNTTPDGNYYYAGAWTLNKNILTIELSALYTNGTAEKITPQTLTYTVVSAGTNSLTFKNSTGQTLSAAPSQEPEPTEPEPDPTPDPDDSGKYEPSEPYLQGPWMEWPFAKGADVSWVTQMEDEGFIFRHVDENGGEEDELMAILKEDCGVNAIRLRVWVNPSPAPNGNIYNDKADVLLKSIDASNLGLDLMIDFHLSDTWADPSEQWLPTAWQGYGVDEIKQAVYNHIYDFLSSLKELDITPKWVQIGNEVSWGLLWDPSYKYDGQGNSSTTGQPNGNDYNGETGHRNFASYIQAGVNAVKEVNKDICTIVHVDNGYSEYPAKWIYSSLEANNVTYDMIGLSLYPAWDSKDILTEYVNPAINYAKQWVMDFQRPVIFAEVGMPWNQADQAALMIQTIMDFAKNDKNIRGIFYWEPEANPYWEADGNGNNGYDKGAFNPETGQPTDALSPFLENID